MLRHNPKNTTSPPSRNSRPVSFLGADRFRSRTLSRPEHQPNDSDEMSAGKESTGFSTREVPLPDDFDHIGPDGPPPALPWELLEALDRDPPPKDPRHASRSSLSTPRASPLPAIPTTPLDLESSQFGTPPSSAKQPSFPRPSTSPANAFRARLGKQRSRDELTSSTGHKDDKPATPEVIPPTPSPDPGPSSQSPRRSLKKAASVEDLGNNNVGLGISPANNGEHRSGHGPASARDKTSKIWKQMRSNRGRASDVAAANSSGSTSDSLLPPKPRRHSIHDERPLGVRNASGSASLLPPSSAGDASIPSPRSTLHKGSDLLEIDETDELRWPTREKFVHDLFHRRQRRRSWSRARGREGDVNDGESESGASDLMSESDAASDLVDFDGANQSVHPRSSYHSLPGVETHLGAQGRRPNDSVDDASDRSVPPPNESHKSQDDGGDRTVLLPGSKALEAKDAGARSRTLSDIVLSSPSKTKLSSDWAKVLPDGPREAHAGAAASEESSARNGEASPRDSSVCPNTFYPP
jgi:hypothetical protein